MTNASYIVFGVASVCVIVLPGHNDISSQEEMETYAALFREAEFLRKQKPIQRPLP